MAHTVIELIAQAIKTRLETITTDNGYQNDVHTVYRPRRTSEGNKFQNLDIIMMQGDMDPDPENHVVGYPPGIGWLVTFSLDLIIRQPEASTVPMDQIINDFVGDVQKAVMQDPSFGSLAQDTRLGSVEFAGEASGFEGATVWIEVLIRVKENDPFTAFA